MTHCEFRIYRNKVAFCSWRQKVTTIVSTVITTCTWVFTFRVSRRPREMYCGHARLCVCLSVCVSVHGRIPTLLHGPGCNLGEWSGMPSSCALLGGFAIGARDALLWQHYGNAWQSPAVIRQAQRRPHALRTNAPAIKSTRLLRVRRYLQRGCSISSILRGCCNANAKC